MPVSTRILVIDQDAHLKESAWQSLRQAGYELTVSESPESGLALARELKPDLIMVSAGSGVGIEVCRQIKLGGDLTDCFVILFTDADPSMDQHKDLDALTDAYISWPVSNGDLLANTQLMIQIKRAQDALRDSEKALASARDELERHVQERTKELAQSNSVVSALSRMGQYVTASLDLTEVLYRVINEAQTLLGVDAISVLLRESSEELIFVAASGESAGKLMNLHIPSGAGVAGKVIQTGQPILVNDESGHALIYRNVDTATGYHTESLLAVPLKLKDEIIGVLEAVNRYYGAFTADEVEVLEKVANWAAIAIGNAQQYTMLERRLKENEAITTIGQALLQTLDREAVLQIIANAAHQLIPRVNRTVIHLFEQASNSLQPVASVGFEETKRPLFPIRYGEGIAGRVIAGGETINVGDVISDPRYASYGFAATPGSILVAPVQSGDKHLGTISVRSETINAFTADDERFLTALGVQAALVIENARLYADLQEALRQEQSARAQMVQSEKLAALGRIVASVAHELNNPLQAIHNALYLVKSDDLPNPQTRSDLEVALREVDRMAELIARLRETYRPVFREEFKPEKMNDLIQEVQKLIGTHLRHKNIQFTFEPCNTLPAVQIIRDQFKQVLINTCLNAVEAMHDGGALAIRTIDSPETSEVSIIITDTGPGIAPDVMPFIFDPFYTTKEGGTGLGLSITYDIVRRHNGRIEVESESGKGSTFKISLPTST